MLPLVVMMALLGSRVGGSDPRGEAVAAARAALAQREGFHHDQPEVLDAVAMEWPDSSLGCGEKGKLYTPAVRRGYRVVLRVGGTVHVVHVSGEEAVVCGRPLTAAELQPEAVEDTHEADAPEPSAPLQRKLVAQAREDLARRLSIEPDAVHFVKLKEVVWPDRSLGCPRPGMLYPQITQDGVQILLRAAGRSYDYRSGSGRAPFLCSHPETPSVR